MKAHITDSEALSAVSPRDIRIYLLGNGWIKQENILDKASIWTNEDDEEVIVIHSSAYSDYNLRVSEILTKLETVESRSQLEILHDIYFSTYDTIRLRNASNEVHRGSIPYDEGLEFNAGAKDLIFSAACSTAVPKSYYATRKPHKAEVFIKDIRLGQTEQGSYILTILNPILPTKSGEQFDLIQAEPYSRAVTKMISTGIERVSLAVQTFQETGSTVDLFDGIQHGVSANLCDALSRIAATSHGHGVELSIAWSKNIKIPEEINTHISVPSISIPTIEAMSQVLKEKQPEEDYRMKGVVIRLQRDKGDSTGIATILDIGSGTPRSISIELSGEQYELAVEAHKKSKTIQCIGEIVRHGRKSFLVNQRQLLLLDEQESFDILEK